MLRSCFCMLVVASAFYHAYAEATIHPHGFWETESTDSHFHDESLEGALTAFFINEKAESIVDFGCGPGKYVKAFRAADLYAEGYDGNPTTPEVSGGVASVLDLSQPFQLEKPFDWVLSLEVGEHIPGEFEATFIDNLHRHNVRGIVLSWAVEGQGGYGHFNERNNDYIKTIFHNLGYQNDVAAERDLRSYATLPWFKSTVMVFRKVM